MHTPKRMSTNKQTHAQGMFFLKYYLLRSRMDNKPETADLRTW